MTLWSGAQDLAEVGLETFSKVGSTLVPIWGAGKALYHGGSGLWNAINGNRKEAINDGADFACDMAGMLPGGFGTAIGLAGGGLGALGSMLTGDHNFPNLGEAVGWGANGVADKLFGKEDEHAKSSTAKDLGGMLGAVGGTAFGPLGMMAGAGVGRWAGGLFDGLFD